MISWISDLRKEPGLGLDRLLDSIAGVALCSLFDFGVALLGPHTVVDFHPPGVGPDDGLCIIN